MDWNLVRSALVGTAIAPFLTLTGNPAIAQELNEPLSFTIENFTQYDLEQFYVSPTSVTDDWGEDRLGDNVLPSGEEYPITIDDNREDCLYDVLGVFSNGEQIDDRRVDLCINEGTYTYYDEEDLVFTFENQTSAVIDELYFTPESQDDYGDDLLGVEVLEPGVSIEVPVSEPVDPNDCIYDFLAVFDDGQELREFVNICETTSVVFSEE
jgi:hypothetical protein